MRISADFVRAFYNEYNEFVNPVTTTPDPLLIWQEEDSINYFVFSSLIYLSIISCFDSAVRMFC